MPAPDVPVQLQLDNQLCFALYRASRAVIRSYGPVLDELGITYVQYLALLVLWQDAPLAVGAVGARLHLETSTLTPLLKRMEESGLVTRTRDPQDERRVLIDLTPQGWAMQDQARGVPEQVYSCFGLAPDEARRLHLTLTELADTLEGVTGAEDRPSAR
ncbi:MarR family transcriptional regulator [Actinotalea sp. M2MS4P-6]|uniref:MarR family winged helix-turn-helix transcriptional regulator n=1 Tax=Actinotalea sp. M2MS4P-6 TaxID=2983762 RepID=UPI0021E38F6B|nr:MarR family transcriptional regulator [Actinotalea sp. M2MS4P-6]MCV2393863.1 MarR family transcriptional regulator [Actinotalea sp. M2MS4P-6]